MKVIAFKGVVLVEHHYGVAAGAGEVVYVRAQEDGLSNLHGEAVYPVAKTVKEVKLASRGKQELYLSVCKVIHVLDPSAEASLEGNAPDALAVFIVEADGAVAVLVQLVGLARGVVLHCEQRSAYVA